MWDDDTCVLTHLTANEAVKILDHLRNDATWKQNGLTLGEPAISASYGDSDSKARDVLVYSIALAPLQVHQLSELLLANETTLRKMADTEKRACDEALARFLQLLIRSAHEGEIEKLEWAERPVTWVKDERRDLWTCDSPPSRAIVTSTKDGWFWEVCVDRATPGSSAYNRFLQLEDAVAWAEEQLTSAEEAEVEEEATPAPVVKRPPVDLTPYRIDPSCLEPERITYEVVLEFDTAPEQFKTMELLCGSQLRYDERYLSPRQLISKLQIDQAQYRLEQPLGPNDDWNRGHSTVTYYRESAAAEQAQLMWNSSRIVDHFRKGKLLRARYGVKEVETGYVTWIGTCENAEKPWPKRFTRTEYMVQRADELTLANALDVDGFREFTGLSHETMTDERVLSALHHRRVDCPAIPTERRADSRRWLREHRELRE